MDLVSNSLRINSLRYLIVGSGRCGTGYISKLLTTNGLLCGHENVFGLGTTKEDKYVAEASWLAVPYLGLHRNLIIIHQLRHPFDSISSIATVTGGRYLRYMYDHIPTLALFDDPIERAAHFWIEWTLRIMGRTAVRWRVEDFEEVKLMCDKYLGLKIDLDVDRSTNKRYTGDRFTDFGRFTDEVCSLTEGFGYVK